MHAQRLVHHRERVRSKRWISPAELEKQDGTVCQVVADKPATLVYLANQACIELHVFLSALAALDRPRQLLFDLDPP